MTGNPLDEGEVQAELSLRPQTLQQYIGQQKVKKSLLSIFKRPEVVPEALDHVLLYGPPGLGKTTLAMVIANELEVGIKTTSGPAIERPGDLVALLNDFEAGMSYLSMRFTDCHVWWKRCCIQRWKISSWISWWVKDQLRIRYIFHCHRSR